MIEMIRASLNALKAYKWAVGALIPTVMPNKKALSEEKAIR